MRPDELLIALAHVVDEFSELELTELIALAAERARAFDASAGNHASRARFALLQDYADRHVSKLAC